MVKNKIYDFSSDNDDDYTTPSLDDNSDRPTEARIIFLKKLINGKKLNSMINFDNNETEVAVKNINKKITDSTKIFKNLQVELKYIKSGSTGHTFKAISTVNPG